MITAGDVCLTAVHGAFVMSVIKDSNLGIHETVHRWAQFAAHDVEVRQIIASQLKTSGAYQVQDLAGQGRRRLGVDAHLTCELGPNGKKVVIALQLKLLSHEANVAAKECRTAVFERFFETL